MGGLLSSSIGVLWVPAVEIEWNVWRLVARIFSMITFENFDWRNFEVLECLNGFWETQVLSIRSFHNFRITSSSDQITENSRFPAPKQTITNLLAAFHLESKFEILKILFSQCHFWNAVILIQHKLNFWAKIRVSDPNPKIQFRSFDQWADIPFGLAGS